MVYGRYNELVNGVYKPTYIYIYKWGYHPVRCFKVVLSTRIEHIMGIVHEIFMGYVRTEHVFVCPQKHV